MTVFLPPPVPLEPPPGDLTALDAVAAQVDRAAACVGVLETSLRGTAAGARSWTGDDATAADARIAVVTELAHQASVALRTAAARLGWHGEHVREARVRIRALLEEQDEALALAWARLAALPDPAVAMRAGAPEAAAVVDDFEAGEARRRAQHAGVLAAVADDAAATARVLAECSTVVGGSGRPGDENRSVAHLALVMPHWGEVELAARGAELAVHLGSLIDLSEREALARAAAGYIDRPAFADALLTGLGRSGVRGLLTDLGGGGLPDDSALAGLLASAFGAADRSQRAHDAVGRVLEAEYVDAQEPSSHEDVVALGMAAVMAAGLRSRSTGPAAVTVLSWGRQLLAREEARAGSHLGGRSIDRAGVPAYGRGPRDPVALVAESLARADDAGLAAAFLADRNTWHRLLARPWDDDAVALALLVERATGDSGPAGQQALRSGLAALGAGLEDNHPGDRTVERNTAAVLAPALGAGLATHVGVAVEALRTGLDGTTGPAGADVLRGVGLITLDRGARAVVSEALFGWATAEVRAATLTGQAAAPGIVAVPAAYLAAHQWAVSMNHTFDGLAARSDARSRAQGWTLLVGWVGHLPGAVGDIAGVVEGYAAILLDMDGTWEDVPDPGMVVDPGTDLTRWPAPSTHETEVRRQASLAFQRTTALLGDPAPPASPPADLLAPLQDAGLSQVEDLVRVARRGMTRNRPGSE